MSNPYLEGNFGPVHDEVTLTDLRVTGTIPDAADRPVPAQRAQPGRPPDPDAYHWFIGDGMVHGVRLDAGRADWYRNRWVRAARWPTRWARSARPARSTTTWTSRPNTNVIGHRGTTLAIVEAGACPTSSPSSSTPSARATSTAGSPPATRPTPTRPGRRRAARRLVLLGLGQPGPVQRGRPDGEGRDEAHGRDDRQPDAARLSLTERYVVVYDLPVAFDLDEAMGGVALPYRWKDDYPARFGLIDRPSGRARALARRRPLLRLPPAQRVRRRRRRRARRGPLGRHVPKGHRVRSRPGSTPACAGGRSTSWAGRSVRTSRRAAAGVPAGRRARRRAPAPLRLRRDHRWRHQARPRPRHTREPGLRPPVRPERGRVRTRPRGLRRGRRLAAVPQLRRGPGHQRPDHHPRAGPGRRTGGDGPPGPPSPVRLPRQLGARRLMAR